MTGKNELGFNLGAAELAAFLFQPTMPGAPLIDVPHFLQSIRDAGYTSMSSAVAELIDNALEAEATDVSIFVEGDGDATGRKVIVIDNGSGMSRDSLRSSLQFGASTRYNSRSGLGRFGMGLPASSLSQAKRVDVYTWPRGARMGLRIGLDLDEILKGDRTGVLHLRKSRAENVCGHRRPRSGTVVVWSKCDRIRMGTDATAKSLRIELGRMFRYAIWRGLRLRINDESVPAVDPLFLRGGASPGASRYGADMRLRIDSAITHGNVQNSAIRIRWSELPVEAWVHLSNEEKRQIQAISRPGISIIRAGREIDRGWYFFGSKRRENYDVWWRAELEFDPNLDELFGVNTLKQGIRPTSQISKVLTPHIEKTAYDLHRRVRAKFARLNVKGATSRGARLAESRDSFLEPPARAHGQGTAWVKKPWLRGLRYAVTKKALEDRSVFVASMKSGKLSLTLNADHPLIRRVDRPADPHFQKVDLLEVLLLAYARAEMSVRGKARGYAADIRRRWSDVLHLFLA